MLEVCLSCASNLSRPSHTCLKYACRNHTHRLEPKHVALVLDETLAAADVEGSFNLLERGRSCIENLRRQDKQMTALNEFLKALYPKKHQAPTSLDNLKTTFGDLREVLGKVHSVPLEMVLRKVCLTAVGEGDWTTLATCLSDGDSNNLSVAMVAAPIRAEVQARIVGQVYSDLAMKEETGSQVFALTTKLHAGDVVKMLSDTLTTELAHLHAVFAIAQFEKSEWTAECAPLESVPDSEAGKLAIAFFKGNRNTDSSIGKNFPIHIVFVQAESSVLKYVKDAQSDSHYVSELCQLETCALHGDENDKQGSTEQKRLFASRFKKLLGVSSLRFQHAHQKRLWSETICMIIKFAL
jgi:hypothetical protein